MTNLLTKSELIITIVFISLGTMLTRFLPVLIFRRGKKISPFIAKLQTLLPSAAIGLLVVYCFRHVDPTLGNRGLPELIALLSIIWLHRFFKNTLISIGGGTALYMFLVQKLF